jgi:hypothetical protein
LPWPPSVVKKLPEVKSVVLRRVILQHKCTQMLTPTVKNPLWLQKQSFFRREQQFFDGNQEHQWVWVQIMPVKRQKWGKNMHIIGYFLKASWSGRSTDWRSLFLRVMFTHKNEFRV